MTFLPQLDVDLVAPTKLRAVILLELSRRQALQFLALESSQPTMWLMGNLIPLHTLPELRYAKLRLNIARNASFQY